MLLNLLSVSDKRHLLYMYWCVRVYVRGCRWYVGRTCLSIEAKETTKNWTWSTLLRHSSSSARKPLRWFG